MFQNVATFILKRSDRNVMQYSYSSYPNEQTKSVNLTDKPTTFEDLLSLRFSDLQPASPEGRALNFEKKADLKRAFTQDQTEDEPRDYFQTLKWKLEPHSRRGKGTTASDDEGDLDNLDETPLVSISKNAAILDSLAQHRPAEFADFYQKFLTNSPIEELNSSVIASSPISSISSSSKRPKPPQKPKRRRRRVSGSDSSLKPPRAQKSQHKRQCPSSSDDDVLFSEENNRVRIPCLQCVQS